MIREALTVPAFFAVALAAWLGTESITRPPISDGKVHVAYWEKWTGFEYAAMKQLVEDYNRSQTRIHVEFLSVSGIADKTLLAVAGRIPPDIAGLEARNVTQFADDNAAMPLDDLCRSSGIAPDNYMSSIWNLCVVGDHIFALPTSPKTVALYYNPTLFREAGLDPDRPPRTWEELVAVNDRITRIDSRGHVSLAGFIPSEPGWWNWMWPLFFGGSLFDGQSKLTVNSPGCIRAFEWVQSFSRKYGPAQLQSYKSGFGSFSSPQNGFLSQKVAMEPQSTVLSNLISKYAPDLPWKVCPMPHPADRPDLAGGTLVDTEILCIPTGAAHPQEAFDFIRYVQEQKNIERLVTGLRSFSPLRRVSPGFYERNATPSLRLFAALASGPNAAWTPKLGIWPELGSELGAAFDAIVLLKKAPKQALDEVQARMQPKLDEYLRRQRLRHE